MRRIWIFKISYGRERETWNPDCALFDGPAPFLAVVDTFKEATEVACLVSMAQEYWAAKPKAAENTDEMLRDFVIIACWQKRIWIVRAAVDRSWVQEAEMGRWKGGGASMKRLEVIRQDPWDLSDEGGMQVATLGIVDVVLKALQLLQEEASEEV